MFAKLVQLGRLTPQMMTHLEVIRHVRQSRAPPTREWKKMFAHHAPTERRTSLGMIVPVATRFVRQSSAPPTNELRQMFAQRVFQERRMPLKMTHLETTRSAT
jgi:hypothetical protein